MKTVEFEDSQSSPAPPVQRTAVSRRREYQKDGDDEDDYRMPH